MATGSPDPGEVFEEDKQVGGGVMMSIALIYYHLICTMEEYNERTRKDKKARNVAMAGIV